MGEPLGYRSGDADRRPPWDRSAIAGRVALWGGCAAASTAVLGFVIQLNGDHNKGVHIYPIAWVAACVGLGAAVFSLWVWQGRVGLGLSLVAILWLAAIYWC